MAFETTESKISGAKKAINILGKIQTLYAYGKDVQEALALYQAGTDASYNAAVNALFTSGERTELLDMVTDIATLTTDWETNHASVIS